jgi:hypothetical protein
VEPYDDRRRVKVHIHFAYIEEALDFDLTIRDEDGDSVSNCSVVNVETESMELTMHLRGENPAGLYTLNISFQVQDGTLSDQHQVTFRIASEQ